MLFSIVDTIGSFHRGRTDLKVLIDSKVRQINKDGFQHFFILNSEYYGQALDERTIRKLYDNFRSLLIHNASLAPANSLINVSNVGEAFQQSADGLTVNVLAFLQISRCAVQKFLACLDELIPGSHQAANIGLKK